MDAATSVEARFSGASGFGVRRTVLHQKMVERAQECGITLLWNTPVAGVSNDGAILRGTVMKARWIIGADGIHSRVRRWSGLDADARQEVRFAQRRHYRVKAWTECMEVHWGQEAQAYVTPLSNDETHAEPSSTERGAVTATRRLRQVYRGNIALAGDASGSVDAITGEGLCLSFRQAIALADSLEKGRLEGYQHAHRRLARRPNTMGRLLLLLDRYPPLRKRALRSLAADPQLFSRLLAAHVGEASPKFLAALSLRLGWQFLTA